MFWVHLLTILLFGLGMVGNFLPVVPGLFVVWLGMLLHRLLLGEASVSWLFLLICLVVVIAAQLLDVLLSWWGARRFGASWYGGLGAVIGLLLGPFLLAPLITPLGGLVAGPILGAVAGELLRGRGLGSAGKAGLGTIVGGLVSVLLKAFVSAVMIIWFYLHLPEAGEPLLKAVPDEWAEQQTASELAPERDGAMLEEKDAADE